MKRELIFTVLIFVPLMVFGQSMDVRIANERVEGSYYKFDLQIERLDSWIDGFGEIGGLGNSDFYFTYNLNGAFKGDPDVENIHPSIAALPSDYSVSAQINTERLQVKVVYNKVSGVWQPNLNEYERICTVKWEINDPSKESDVEWDHVNTDCADGDGDVITIVNWEGSGDISLPVQISEISATTDERGIVLRWRTESEADLLGFHVWRSLKEQEGYILLTNTHIEPKGSSSRGVEYQYIDKDVESGMVYWYKIEAALHDGRREFYGPLSVDCARAVPSNYYLSQNYPNPFNPVTSFSYQIPVACDVTVTVYNLLGEEVKVLIDKYHEPGYYRLEWNGLDKNENRAASGIYLLHIMAGSFSMVRKMALMR